MLRLDHVILAVSDFEAAAGRLRREFGLVALVGGVHPRGTKNWIVPLEPPQYLELLAIDDHAKMSATPGGQWLIEQLTSSDFLVSFAVRIDDIDGVAARTGVASAEGSIIVDGVEAPGWRTVSPRGAGALYLPFFIQYHGDTAEEMESRWRRYREAASPAQPKRFEWVEVSGDAGRLRDWLGGEDLSIRVVEGEPRVRSVCISTQRGDIVLR